MKFENKIKGFYFYTFADGSYSDYRVNSLAICDHAVTQEEWYTHLQQYRKDFESNKEEIIQKYSINNYYIPYGTDAYKEFEAWRKENDPDKTFANKHGMIFVEYEELHKDD